MSNQLPDVFFGEVDVAQNTSERVLENENNDDDVPLAKTPEDIIAILGFDPLEIFQ